MGAGPKLTKKQKKSLAFRERKQGKGKSKDAVWNETNDVPASEDQDAANLRGGDVEKMVEGDEDKGKGPGGMGDSVAKSVSKGKGKVDKTKKRKRDTVSEGDAGADNADAEIEKPKRKRKKGVDDDEGPEAGSKEAGEGEEIKSDAKRRFILFVGMLFLYLLTSVHSVPGNLKYTTSVETIKKHFESCGESVFD
jgi:nucleolar protein 6